MVHDEQQRYLEFAWRTAMAAGSAILPHFREVIAVEDKRNFMGYDPVTVADRAAETVIRAAIKARVSRITASTARSTAARRARRRFTWVIDPIDGTKSFILGPAALGDAASRCTTARAPVVGVVHQPFVGETFLGAAGGTRSGAAATQRRALRTRPCPRIEDAIVVDHRSAPVPTPAETGGARRPSRPGAVPALRRRLLLLHAARDGLRRRRDRERPPALRHPGADARSSRRRAAW